MRKQLFITLLTAAFVTTSACSVPQVDPRVANKPDIPEKFNTKEPPRTRGFVKISSPHHQIMESRTTVNRSGISIADAITVINGLSKAQIVPKDPYVNLTQKIDIRASDMTVKDYLQYMTDVTDYDYTLKLNGEAPIIEVASMVMKQWNLSAIRSMPEAVSRAGLSATISAGVGDNQSGGGQNQTFQNSLQGSGTQLEINRGDDIWEDVVENAQSIVGAGDDARTLPDIPASPDIFMDSLDIPAPGVSGQSNAQSIAQAQRAISQASWLVPNRRLGTITAYSRPRDIRRLDAWLSKMEHEINRQVFLDVAILDVVSSRGDGYGIDWAAIYEDVGFSSGLGSASVGGANSLGGNSFSLVDGGSWALSATGSIGAVTLSSLITALSEEGSVSLESQPKVTVTNGYTAYLGATEEFSYVANIEVLPGSGLVASEPIVTTTLGRISVGLKLGITPSILPDGRIMVEVIPVLSSIRGFTDVGAPPTLVSTPNIAIQELATQVITESGQPIHLGGLISNRIIENAKRMPLAGGETGKRIGELLGSVVLEEEGRELLIVITPTEVRS